MENQDLNQEIYSQEEEENLPKQIKTEQEAIKYAYGVNETRKEIENIQSLAESERAKWQQKIEEVNVWEEERINPLLGKLEYMNNLLKFYHMQQVEGAENDSQLNKVKSIKLPYGVTLKSKAPQTKFEITDEEKYKEYAKENNLLQEPAEPKPKWGDIKKRFQTTDEGKVVDEDGQVVDFVKASTPPRSFEVK